MHEEVEEWGRQSFHHGLLAFSGDRAGRAGC